jgi:uncharacterized protein
VTSEPRVEELLATIRKAIDRDINELDARDMRELNPPPLRGTFNPQKAAPPPQPAPPAYAPTPPQNRDGDRDLASLRQRVQRQKVELQEPVFEPRQEPELRHTARQPSLYAPLAPSAPPNYAPEPAPYYPPAHDDWAYAPAEPVHPAVQHHAYVEHQHYAPAEPIEMQAQHHGQEALLSPESAYAAQASFQALANSMIAQLGGDAGLQDKARDMLRPLLKHWLDENLPSLVEKLVREEIERVARRGR